ncbi:transcription factor bHLH13-like [Abrus precatorius]|uniref:Transcription factor bHLH13-like n=1 Tax=Abrus precatorius TaxID=3816 RepID=A0A8B8MJB8_ABRPR|nr:transcription factor bHLH13-like [Abrus precatorius]
MEGYTDTDSVTPLLSQILPFSSSSSSLHPSSVDPSSTIAETGNNTTSKKRDRQLGHSNCEILKMERERRSKMTQMFTQLRTTVPGLFPQATREVIINETIEYIKELEKKKQRLEELKESMKEEQGRSMLPCANNRNCSITVTVSSNVAFFGIQSVARPGLITIILKLFSKHQAEILAANVSVNNGKLILAITALVHNGGDGNSDIENIKKDIMSLQV